MQICTIIKRYCIRICKPEIVLSTCHAPNYNPGEIPTSFDDIAFTKWPNYQDKVKACLKKAKKNLKVHIAKKKHQFIVNKVDEIKSERRSACSNKFFKRTDPDSILSSQQLYAVSYAHESKTNPDGTPLKITSASPKTVKSVVVKVWGKIFSSAKNWSDLIFPGWDGTIFQHNR